MKRFLIQLTIFGLGLLILNFLYFLLISHTDWDFIKRTESLNLSNPTFDLLVLGNSLAMDGIDTQYLSKQGLSAYNMAIGGSSLKTNYIQLEEYLNRYEQKPSYVILGLGSYMNNFERDDIHPIVEYTMEEHRYTFSDLPFIKFRWLGAELMKKIVSSAHRNATISQGQLKFKKIETDKTKRNPALQLNLDKYKSAKWILEILELCAAHNIQVFVIEMPGFKKTQNVDALGPYTLPINENNYRLYNFNSQSFCRIFDDSKDWIGNNHLNEIGAKRFTKHLYKEVLKNNSPKKEISR